MAMPGNPATLPGSTILCILRPGLYGIQPVINAWRGYFKVRQSLAGQGE